MATVIASHVPNTISVEKLQKFFSFCGDIKSINLITKVDKTSSYEVNFESPKALDTALLLNEAELEGVPINIEKAPAAGAAVASFDDPPKYKDVASSTTVESGAPATGDNKIQSDAVKTGDNNYDDINQEEKPKYAIMAQLLANGYTLSDKIIGKSIEVDKQNGYSAKFKSFLGDLDKKYIHSEDPQSDFNKNVSAAQSKLADLQIQLSKSKYTSKLSHYFEKAANHPYGIKVHEFYKGVAGDVKDVHAEAKRLSELQKKNEAEAAENPTPVATSSTPVAGTKIEKS
ncbi:uncharacterized protein RJT20DRAFT_134284 [Scheffersomyces xylosifermentans]|uniref:uncharacterized protein n=1 Tax=Scheffersomyces xylosifermentans TaxID=1304137 RepID=UPI00315D1FCA